jgi:hypothetical protein
MTRHGPNAFEWMAKRIVTMRNLSVGFLMMALSVLMIHDAMAAASSKSYKISITIPAIVGINVPYENEMMSEQGLNPVREIIIEDAWRDDRLVQLKTMVVK